MWSRSTTPRASWSRPSTPCRPGAHADPPRRRVHKERSVNLLAQVVTNGALLGGLYAVMALGLALVWGVLNIVNLAHGAFIMLGAYCSWHLFRYLHIDPFLGLPITAVVMLVLGYIVQRGLLNLIVRAPMFNTLLLTFGLDVVLTYLAQLAFSADFRTINPAYAGSQVHLGPLVLPVVRRGAFAAAIALTIGMWLFLLHTRLGRAIRATAQNLVAAPLYAKSFAISIIGGLDNPLGVLVGGLFLGIVESLTTLYVGPTFADVASFGILVLVLIVRPTGLLGKTA